MSQKTQTGNNVQKSTFTTDQKFLINASAKHFQKRLLSLPYKEVEFTALTLRGQLEYMKQCAEKKILPNLSGKVTVALSGVYGVEYLLKFFELIRSTKDNDLLTAYMAQFEEGSEEYKKIALYLSTGIATSPNMEAVPVSPETEKEIADSNPEPETNEPEIDSSPEIDGDTK